jgi:hypothetical protein
VAVTLADPFQLLIFTYLIGPLPFGQIFTHLGKKRKPVFPKKKPVDTVGMIFSQSGYGIETADRQFLGKSISHKFSLVIYYIIYENY